ncbi:hypothetical protein, partial [Actinomadura fibrosa]|uniref:hypothetical protein n=1 Tax=Actinomadura fibrosa TaxID=111802 RepID=UPI0013F143A2
AAADPESAARLLGHLRDLARARRRPPSDLAGHVQVLWLAELPGDVYVEADAGPGDVLFSVPVIPLTPPAVLEEFDGWLALRHWYRTLRDLAEQAAGHDVVLAAGLLAWRPHDGPAVHDHLLSTPVRIVVDERTERIDVVLAGHTTLRDRELLSGRPGFRPAAWVADAVQAGQGFGLNTSVGDVLRKWCSTAFPGAGDTVVYREDWAPEAAGPPPPVPRVRLAPALVVRPPGRAAVAAYHDAMIAQLAAGAAVPEGLARFLAPNDRPQVRHIAEDTPDIARDILTAVLVRGLRVLVATSGATASGALRAALPPDLASLTVADPATAADVADALLVRAAAHDPGRHGRHVADLAERVEAADQEVAELRARLRRIEDEEAQRGSPDERHRAEAPELSWMPVRPDMPPGPPISRAEAAELVVLLAEETPGRKARTAHRDVDPGALPSPPYVRTLIEAEAAAAERAGRFHSDLASALRGLDAALLARLDGCASIVGSALADLGLDGHPGRWNPADIAVRAFGDALAHRRPLIWSRVAEMTARAEWAERALATTDGRVELPPDPDLRGLAAAAQDLRDHLAGGGSLKRGPLRSAAQRQAEPLLNGARVDGAPPTTPELLDLVITHLTVRIACQELQYVWEAAGISFPADPPPADRIARFVRAHARLARVRTAMAAIEETSGLLARAGLTVPLSHPLQWHGYVSALEAALEGFGVERAAADIAALRDSIGPVDADDPPELLAALDALDARDAAAYGRCLNALAEARRERAHQIRCEELLARVRAVHPDLANLMLATDGDEAWSTRTRRWDEAWAWARTAAQLATTAPSTAADEARAALASAEEHLETLRADLTSARAWGAALARLAGLDLASAVSAASATPPEIVPAWILPLWRIPETLPPRPGSFDVVIVDGEHNAGAEALFLLWLAPRLILIGPPGPALPTPEGPTPATPVPHPFHDVLTPTTSLFTLLTDPRVTREPTPSAEPAQPRDEPAPSRVGPPQPRSGGARSPGEPTHPSAERTQPGAESARPPAGRPQEPGERPRPAANPADPQTRPAPRGAPAQPQTGPPGRGGEDVWRRGESAQPHAEPPRGREEDARRAENAQPRSESTPRPGSAPSHPSKPPSPGEPSAESAPPQVGAPQARDERARPAANPADPRMRPAPHGAPMQPQAGPPGRGGEDVWRRGEVAQPHVEPPRGREKDARPVQGAQPRGESVPPRLGATPPRPSTAPSPGESGVESAPPQVGAPQGRDEHTRPTTNPADPRTRPAPRGAPMQPQAGPPGRGGEDVWSRGEAVPPNVAPPRVREEGAREVEDAQPCGESGPRPSKAPSPGGQGVESVPPHVGPPQGRDQRARPPANPADPRTHPAPHGAPMQAQAGPPERGSEDVWRRVESAQPHAELPQGRKEDTRRAEDAQPRAASAPRPNSAPPRPSKPPSPGEPGVESAPPHVGPPQARDERARPTANPTNPRTRPTPGGAPAQPQAGPPERRGEDVWSRGEAVPPNVASPPTREDDAREVEDAQPRGESGPQRPGAAPPRPSEWPSPSEPGVESAPPHVGPPRGRDERARPAAGPAGPRMGPAPRGGPVQPQAVPPERRGEDVWSRGASVHPHAEPPPGREEGVRPSEDAQPRGESVPPHVGTPRGRDERARPAAGPGGSRTGSAPRDSPVPPQPQVGAPGQLGEDVWSRGEVAPPHVEPPRGREGGARPVEDAQPRGASAPPRPGSTSSRPSEAPSPGEPGVESVPPRVGPPRGRDERARPAAGPAGPRMGPAPGGPVQPQAVPPQQRGEDVSSRGESVPPRPGAMAPRPTEGQPRPAPRDASAQPQPQSQPVPPEQRVRPVPGGAGPVDPRSGVVSRGGPAQPQGGEDVWSRGASASARPAAGPRHGPPSRGPQGEALLGREEGVPPEGAQSRGGPAVPPPGAAPVRPGGAWAPPEGRGGSGTASDGGAVRPWFEPAQRPSRTPPSGGSDEPPAVSGEPPAASDEPSGGSAGGKPRQGARESSGMRIRRGRSIVSYKRPELIELVGHIAEREPELTDEQIVELAGRLLGCPEDEKLLVGARLRYAVEAYREGSDS